MSDLRTAFRRLDRLDLEAMSRQRLDYRYLGKNIALTRVLGSFLLYVDTLDSNISPHLIMDGFWEMWITQAIAARVQPGWRCAVHGSTYGYYAILLAKLGAVEVHTGGEHTDRGVELSALSAKVNGCSVSVRSRDLFNQLAGPYDFIKVSGTNYSKAVDMLGQLPTDGAQVLLELRASEYTINEIMEHVVRLQERHRVETIDHEARFHEAQADKIEGSVWLWLTPK